MKERLLRLPVIGTAMRVQERYTDDAADNFAASIGFFGFLSLFPIILVGLSVLGFFIRGDVNLEMRVVSAVRDAVPGLQAALGEDGLEGVIDQIGRNAESLLSIGTATLLFSGLKVVGGAQRALAVVFRMEVPTGITARLQQVLALAVLGLLTLLGSAIGGSAGVDFGGPNALLVSLGLTAVAFAVDFMLFLAAYRFLSPDPGEPPVRQLLPGAVLAAIAWVALKAGGSSLLVRQGDDSTYGPLAGAVGLLVLLYLAGRVFMYGAELSALLAERRDGGIEGADDDLQDDQDDRVRDSRVGPVVTPRPVVDVAPAPASLARLAGTAAVLGWATRMLGRR